MKKYSYIILCVGAILGASAPNAVFGSSVLLPQENRVISSGMFGPSPKATEGAASTSVRNQQMADLLKSYEQGEIPATEAIQKTPSTIHPPSVLPQGTIVFSEIRCAEGWLLVNYIKPIASGVVACRKE